MNEEPTILNIFKVIGNCFVTLPKPNPIQNSKRVNPIVAPEQMVKLF